MRPVPVEKQWTLWPRIARPFECRSCGAQYEPTLDPEVESKECQIMRWQRVGNGWYGESHRIPRYRYCRNPGCENFYDYVTEAVMISKGESAFGLLPPGRAFRPMRRKWLKMPEPANDGP